MKVCLINPPRLLTLKSVSLRATPPLGMAYIAGTLLHNKHEVYVIDAIAEAPNQINEFNNDIVLHGLHDAEIINKITSDTDVVGIGCMFSNNWLANRRLINAIHDKFPNIKIMIGGEHATAVPELCLRQCKGLLAVIMGEGEETTAAVVNALQENKILEDIPGIVFKDNNGVIIKTISKNRVKNIEEIAWPAWHLFPLEEYMEHKFSYGVDRGRSLPVMATRGCPYQCTFCSSPLMWGTKYYMRSPEDMANEVAYIHNQYKVTNFDFYDLTAIIKKEWIIAFCKELANRNLNITWQIPAGTRSEAIDEEVAEWLYKSGCRNITYAPESGSPEILKLIKKKVKLNNMLHSIKASARQNLNIKLNMMIGFPDEKHYHVLQTTWFLIKASWHGAHDALPSIFSPYPGSELFDRLMKEGKINPEHDDYWYSIIYADDYTKGIFYANHLNRATLWFYIILQLLAFYISNYLFRPQRLWVTFKNMITKNYQSRAEITLAELVKRNKEWTFKTNAEFTT